MDVDAFLNNDNADNGRDNNLSLFSEPISQPVSGPSNTQASQATSAAQSQAANPVVPQKRSKKAHSVVHDHFMHVKKGRITKRKCKYCSSEYSLTTATGPLQHHITNSHPKIAKQWSTDQNDGTTASQTGFLHHTTLSNLGHRSSTVTNALMTKAQNTHLNMLILEMLIKNFLSFRFVESPSFKDVLHYLNNTASLWSRVTYRNVALDVFTTMRAAVKDLLADVHSRISLTMDQWTASNGDSYLGVTAHWIDNNWNLKKIVFDVSGIPHPHDADNMFIILKQLLQRFNITTKLLSITSDNGPNIINTIEALRIHLNDNLLATDFFGKRCAAHVMNLIVEAGIKPISQVVGKIRSFVIKLNKSSLYTQVYRQIAKELGQSQRKIPADVSTRWNSLYLMLDVASDVSLFA
ncbi:hypothetical protein PsorP6_003177 [Peronosclerospora sorghi]|uniref:Uncharacterized protein n=1 Tax=Peronosclerospora sorghi TaxID=230839 RepID=A0ACC0VPH1_9STRA|nr:hypothetical protein PsorP6_003177 [Peronosclerospora sorghi]